MKKLLVLFVMLFTVLCYADNVLVLQEFQNDTEESNVYVTTQFGTVHVPPLKHYNFGSVEIAPHQSILIVNTTPSNSGYNSKDQQTYYLTNTGVQWNGGTIYTFASGTHNKTNLLVDCILAYPDTNSHIILNYNYYINYFDSGSRYTLNIKLSFLNNTILMYNNDVAEIKNIYLNDMPPPLSNYPFQQECWNLAKNF